MQVGSVKISFQRCSACGKSYTDPIYSARPAGKVTLTLFILIISLASVRNRRFSFWHHPLQLLSILLLLGGSVGAYADTYDAATNVLTIPLVTVGNTAYTNVKITVGGLISLGGGTAANTYDTYDAATNQLTIPSVLVGTTTYTNVVITVGGVISVGGYAPVPTSAPLLVLVNPLGAATVGQAYSANVVAGILPSSNYTFMMDTLANGVLPTGMTLHIDGTLSGTPFATGKTDVNGNQVPNTYTFGVCAVDTLSRSSTNPCPQTSITVNPATLKLTTSIVGMGTVSANPTGPTYSPGTVVTLTATPGPGFTFAGWSGVCAGTGSCVVTMNAAKAVTATFSATPPGGSWFAHWDCQGYAPCLAVMAPTGTAGPFASEYDCNVWHIQHIQASAICNQSPN